MARVLVSKEGAESLRQLSTDLKTANSDIENHGTTLMTTVVGLGEGLGLYEQPILDVIKKVNAVQKAAEDSVEELTAKLEKRASDIDALVGQGFN